MHISYTLCTTADKVASSRQSLGSAACLLVDCEGRDLGCRDGALSLISIGTPESSEIFVYDVVQLDRAAFAPILDLLSSPTKLKVLWDGRMDYVDIFHTYGTALQNTLDLQIVEIMSRAKRSETDYERMNRLESYLGEDLVDRSQKQYEGIHLLVGMGRCLTEHRLALGDGKDAQIRRVHRYQAHLWMKRPLPTELLNYAAKDIHLMRLIYLCFENQGYLEPKTELLEQSQRFVSMHADLTLKPLKTDRYRSSPVLPLDILKEPTGILNECEACHRKLSSDCFQQTGLRRRRMCKVCYVVWMRNNKYIPRMDDETGWVEA